MKSVVITALLASAAIAAPHQVQAQSNDDVVVMRRVIAPPQTRVDPITHPVPTTTPSPAPTLPPTVGPTWVTGDWAGPTSGCGSLDQTREVSCRLSGIPVSAAACPSPAPENQRTLTDHSTCAFDWKIIGHGDWSSTCSTTATRGTVSRCERQDGNTADDLRCAGQPRPAPETAEILTTCTFAWTVGDWSAYSSTCSSSATRSRIAECHRSDGAVATGADCGVKPATAETAAVHAGCDHRWQYGTWTSADTCSASTSQSRTAVCIRSIDGADVIVDGDACGAVTKEAVTRSGISDTSGCNGNWTINWSPATTCSASELTERSRATCSGGTCDPSRKPSDGETRTASCTSACGTLKPAFRVSTFDSSMVRRTIGPLITGDTAADRLKVAQRYCESLAGSGAYQHRLYCGYIDTADPAGRSVSVYFATNPSATLTYGTSTTNSHGGVCTN